VSGKVKFGLGRFSEWVRIPPRVVSSKGDGGYGVEIGVCVEPELANKCEKIVLEIEQRGTGVATFPDGSQQRIIPGSDFGNGYEPFQLEGGMSTEEQSSTPGDVTIKAFCQANSRILGSYDFTVCAHPEDFKIVPGAGRYCLIPNRKFGVQVEWRWNSDSVDNSDLNMVELYEVSKMISDHPKPSQVLIGRLFARVAGDMGSYADDRVERDKSYIRIYDKFYGHNPEIEIEHHFDCFRCAQGDIDISDDTISYIIDRYLNVYRCRLHEWGECDTRCRTATNWNFSLQANCTGF